MALPKVSILVLNFQGIKYTPSCITSLYKNTLYPFHLIVVDNCISTDGSREWLREFESKLPNSTMIFNEAEDGFAAGVNKGLEYATGDYVLLLNNDTLVFEPGWLHGLVEEMEADPTIAIQGVKLLYPNDLIQHAGVTFGHETSQDRICPFHIGRFEKREKYTEKRVLPAVTFACALIRRPLLADGLDTVYGRGNYEDMDFCCKVRKAGHRILYNGEVEIYHYEGGTTLRQPQPAWNEHIGNNWRIFSERWEAWLREDLKRNEPLYQAGLPLDLPQNWFGVG